MTQMKKIFALCLVLILAASALAGCSSKPGKYEILITDEAGDPVEGITIQFCSDTLCETRQVSRLSRRNRASIRFMCSK